MKVDELLEKAKDGLETKMVYSEPYEVDGVTVIVASTVGTGGGGGDSRDEKGRSGEGGGFGLSAKPVGAYVIKDGKLRWEPAVDVNRLLAALGAIAVAALFAATRLAKLKYRAAPPVDER
ncbi:spore germination protein GerW family protein [Amycolatopsis nalaikhensis]|uniref:Spore germination protein GerW family protein n=1 Tax=Amycolatopsis nalaikhensis TaxID=715472 RepID=A0ABY8XE23_9PSEU|nr:spore germination protein GerW family protein [Amycolatopsis sp. 2-2]WIV53862.1 spore germination protein GerW family protein [Amycolatopsis sp. 2-2]